MQAAGRRVSLDLPRTRQHKTSTSLGWESGLRPVLHQKQGAPWPGTLSVCRFLVGNYSGPTPSQH